MLWRECASAELSHLVHRNEWTDVFHIHLLNLVVLVRSAETVEEVDEWNASLQCCQVSNSREVHHFLYRTFAKHSETCLTASHHVAVVTEDTEWVAGNGTCRNVEYRWEQLARNLVHVRNHQKKTLRSSEGGSERTCLERTVYSTCCTSLRLHFLYENCVAEEILATCNCPLIHVLSHWRRWSDGVDGSHLGEHVCYMSRSGVTITSDKFLFFTHIINR